MLSRRRTLKLWPKQTNTKSFEMSKNSLPITSQCLLTSFPLDLRRSPVIRLLLTRGTPTVWIVVSKGSLVSCWPWSDVLLFVINLPLRCARDSQKEFDKSWQRKELYSPSGQTHPIRVPFPLTRIQCLLFSWFSIEEAILWLLFSINGHTRQCCMNCLLSTTTE